MEGTQLSKRPDGVDDGRAVTGASVGGLVDGSGVGAGTIISIGGGLGEVDGLAVGVADGFHVGLTDGFNVGHGPQNPSVKWFFTSLVAMHRGLVNVLKQKRTPGKGAPFT